MEAIFSGASTSRRGRPPATDPFLELDISLSPNQHRGRIMRVLRPPADTSLLAAGRAACLPRSTRQVLSNRATQNNTTPGSTQWTLSWPRSKVPPRTVDRFGMRGHASKLGRRARRRRSAKLPPWARQLRAPRPRVWGSDRVQGSVEPFCPSSQDSVHH